MSKWTVLVYMAGNNNLSGAAEASLKAMQSVPISSDVNVVVQIRTAAGTRRYHVNGTATTESPGAPDTSMADKDTLTKFINWGLGAYPATHSFLIIWSHGSGLDDTWLLRSLLPLPTLVRRPGLFQPYPPLSWPRRGRWTPYWIAQDGIDFLTIDAFHHAIQNSTAKRVDVLGCDACLMSMIEIGYEMRDVASLFVASETDAPSESWPYPQILTELSGRPTMTPTALAAASVSAFEAWYADPDNPNDLTYATLAALDLAANAALVRAMDALADALIAALPTVCSAIQTMRKRVVTMENSHYVDLGDLLDNLAKTFPATAISDAAEEAYEALKKACAPICKVGKRARPTNGLSIYFPASLENPNLHVYQVLSFGETRWPIFLRRYLSAVVT